MSRVRFNPRLHQQLGRDPRFRAGMDRQQQRAVAAVRTVAQTFRETGYFARSLRTSGNRIETTDPFGHLIEFGSQNNAAYAPLRRGVRIAGLEVREMPK